jgi:hypothetical protein
MADSSEIDPLNRRLAVAVGLGLTIEDACDLAGCSKQTYYNRLQRAEAYFAEVIAEVQPMGTRFIETRVRKAQDRIDLNLQKSEIKRLAYDKLQQMLQEEDGKPLSEALVGKILSIALEFTDEKPATIQKRENTNVIVHQVSEEVLDRFDRLIARIPQAIGPAGSAQKVIDVTSH